MDKFFYSKAGGRVFGPYANFQEAKEMAGAPRSLWYERRQAAAGTYVYWYAPYGSGEIVVGEREAMLALGLLTVKQASIPALERKEAMAQNIQLQSALADLQVARQNVRDLQAKNDELVRRLHAIRDTVELFS